MSEKSIALAIVVNDEREVLLIERANQELLQDGSALRWAFPGGKQEEGEQTAETAVRETYEETGYTVQAEELLYAGPHPTAPVQVAYWACRLAMDIEPHEVTDPAIRSVAWVAIAKISEYMTSAVHPSVRTYLNERYYSRNDVRTERG